MIGEGEWGQRGDRGTEDSGGCRLIAERLGRFRPEVARRGGSANKYHLKGMLTKFPVGKFA